MATSLSDRPFDNYRVAITDPMEFFGRKAWLENVLKTPLRIRILLGGRRFGKTSALRAIEWTLLDNAGTHRDGPFPIFVSLEVEQPQSLSNLRYILIDRLRGAMQRWRESPWQGLRETYRRFLRQIVDAEATVSFLKLKVANPERDRALEHTDFRTALLDTIKELSGEGFSGVCFLLDEAEFIVRHDWANDACSYFRGLKDTDTALKPFFGIILTGYRGVRDYEQKIGSPLYNIAEIDWLPLLDESPVRELIEHRAKAEGINLAAPEFQLVLDWAGGHPFLAQQVINAVFDEQHGGISSTREQLMEAVLYSRDHDFSSWWNAGGKSDGFGDSERSVYSALRQKRKDSTKNLANTLSINELQVRNTLELLTGTGVIRQIDVQNYGMGSQLFDEWVSKL